MMLNSVIGLSRSARGLVRDTQAVHRTLAHFVEGRFLWAFIPPLTLVVRHEKEVDWSSGFENAAVSAQTSPMVTPAGRVCFSLVACPTFCKARPDGRGKRLPLPPDKWEEWVRRKLSDAIDVEQVECELLRVARGKRHEMRVTHQNVMFTGVGAVIDEEKLHALMCEGVGTGKAYGLGLLQVRSIE